MAARMLGQQARQFSTSVIRPAAKLVKPPIQVYGLEGRYATALFSAASKQSKLDQVEQELGKVSTLIKDPKISTIVMNPHVKQSIKQKTIHDILSKAKVSPITINLIRSRMSYLARQLDLSHHNIRILKGFCCDLVNPAALQDVLADNGRLTITGDVITAFGKMMSAHRGEVICSVTTAQPLDQANLSELKVALKGFLQKGETIKLETKTDSSILGGMIVSIGDKYVDMSTKTKIQKLTKVIREA